MVKQRLMLALTAAVLAGCQSTISTGGIAYSTPTVVPTPAPSGNTNAAPAPGTAIQWDQAPAAPSPSSPQSGTQPSQAGAAPGTTIHWNEPAPGANAPASSTGTAAPQAAQPAPPPPSGTAAPEPPAASNAMPGTVQPVAPDVRWKTAVQGDTVQVEIIDPASHYRVESIALLAPDGREYAAKDITRYTASTDAPYSYDRPEFGLGGFGGSGHSGVNLGLGMAFPLGSSPPSPDDPDRYFARTYGVVYVPDPVAYRRTADKWSVRVRLRDPARVAYSVQFPAPVPPRS